VGVPSSVESKEPNEPSYSSTKPASVVQIRGLTDRLVTVERRLAELTKALNEVEKATNFLVVLFRRAETGARLLVRLIWWVRQLSALATGLGILYGVYWAIKHGGPFPTFKDLGE